MRQARPSGWGLLSDLLLVGVLLLVSWLPAERWIAVGAMVPEGDSATHLLNTLYFQQRLGVLEGYVEKIAALGPQIVEHYRERLNKTLKELLAAQDIDENRIIQETAIYADKVNYTEEIVRLQSHFKQFREILAAADAPVGRRLDFLVQEMNREINTTASKANSTEAAQLSVDVKSEIEKLREQIQNIE